MPFMSSKHNVLVVEQFFHRLILSKDFTVMLLTNHDVPFLETLGDAQIQETPKLLGQKKKSCVYTFSLVRPLRNTFKELMVIVLRHRL